MPQSETAQPSACDRVLAHYRERVGAAWRPADDLLFRAAWNEGAHERERQLEARLDDSDIELARALRKVTRLHERLTAAGELLVRCNRELGALSCPLTELFEDIDRHLSEKAP